MSGARTRESQDLKSPFLRKSLPANPFGTKSEALNKRRLTARSDWVTTFPSPKMSLTETMSQKVSLKTDYHIPESWDLYGNIGKDPIAQSLMVRLEAGALASSVPARWYQRVVLTPVINLDKKFEDFHAQHQSEYPT